MARRSTLFGVVAFALCIAGGSPAFAEESTEAQAGHNLYGQYCEVCHGLRGQGDGPLAVELRVAPADLTTIAMRRNGVFPEVEMREIIDGRRKVRAHGLENMPLWGKEFSRENAGAQYEDQVRDKVQSLVTYLKSIQKVAPSAPAKK
jgi:mono/diheme cytochrome c family protein